MRTASCLCLLATWAAVTWAEVPPARPRPGELVNRAAVIRPTADELKWQKIPWVTDLTEGLKLAQTEKRPIFLWVTGDDPLERC